ncbi:MULTISPECIES: TM2 domain-containing protein [Tenacibaculum]|jgi:TM2 domain-containing membrane protein YozV|uniref:TM2 domain-containing protein n=1 Tax=Tenacibaculum larymnensis TaxID=2878201 RepID=A0A9X4EPH0_9FLAO|nr:MULTISPECIES: TM2 domain-containing protein [Tenacibaculum]MDE1207831.1 TM2 domain-containing protein [Tenacibaculum larymnensis]RLJ96803.1 TM2 domain-containing membrane protein YozV [Tenacibaculum discolor]
MNVIDENGNTVPNQESKRVLAGILAILIGSIGIHKFILGYTKEGIIQIVATFITCGLAGIIPFIEGIIYLTKSDEEFIETYQVNQKGWF